MADAKKPRKSLKRASISQERRSPRQQTVPNRVDSLSSGPPGVDAASETRSPDALTEQPQPAVPVFPRIAAEDVDAVARSSVALADGVQALGRALIEYQRQSVAGSLSAARALIDARNLQDVIEVQRRFINGSVENAVRESGSLAQLARQVANEAWAPFWPRVGIALGKLKKPAA